MSLKQELKKLRQQKRTELRTLHDTYVATKRDVKRQMAPDRIIRRHSGISMAVAAVLGMILAPRPAARGMVNGEKPARGFFSGGFLGLIGRLFGFVFQLVGHFISPARQLDAPSPEGAPAPAKAKPTGWIQSLVEMVLRQVDFNKLTEEVIHSFAGKPRKESPSNGDAQPAAPPEREQMPSHRTQSEEL
jgi:hypothetical protein